MLNNLLPNKIIKINDKIFTYLIIVTLFIIFAGLLYSFIYSPPDYVQGESVRIMYIHVPASFIATSCFGLMALISLIAIIFKIKILPLVAKSLAPIGLLFTLISIISGSLWGKPTWGTFWVWDARLTSMLILLFLYIFYFITWKLINDYKKAVLISSIFALIGAINIPIIKYSVTWWNTLHQPSSISITSAPTIHYTMLIPLVVMMIGLIFYSFTIFLMKYKTELMKLKIKKIKLTKNL